jgi:hypothetical protein
MEAPMAADALEDRPFWLEKAEDVTAVEEDVAAVEEEVATVEEVVAAEKEDVATEADVESVLGGKLVFVVILVNEVVGSAVVDGVYKGEC